MPNFVYTHASRSPCSPRPSSGPRPSPYRQVPANRRHPTPRSTARSSVSPRAGAGHRRSRRWCSATTTSSSTPRAPWRSTPRHPQLSRTTCAWRASRRRSAAPPRSPWSATAHSRSPTRSASTCPTCRRRGARSPSPSSSATRAASRTSAGPTEFQDAVRASLAVAPPPVELLSYVAEDPLEFEPGGATGTPTPTTSSSGYGRSGLGQPYAGVPRHAVSPTLGLTGTSLPRGAGDARTLRPRLHARSAGSAR